MKDIVLATINAKWIHPSLALRLLKANLGNLEERCRIIEFALRQPLREKIEMLLAARPRILGISVSIWNHTATLELLGELEKEWARADSLISGHEAASLRPVVIIGGPEVSHLPEEAEIFRFADYVVRGEGEIAFRELCNELVSNEKCGMRNEQCPKKKTIFIDAGIVDVYRINSAYHLYTDEDIANKLIYVEASRGCVYNCEFCLSARLPLKAAKEDAAGCAGNAVREFPLDQFLAQMDALIKRGVKTFKFLDRSFNTNINRAVHIMEFFLNKIEEQQILQTEAEAAWMPPVTNLGVFSKKKLQVKNPHGCGFLTTHFEMVPSLFPQELSTSPKGEVSRVLRETLARFPPGTLRLEIGIQTLNSEVAALISRPSNPEKELETLRLLLEKTSAILHVDLIAGLPGEDLASFGRGFDQICNRYLSGSSVVGQGPTPYIAYMQKILPRLELQLGILKLLPGAPISRHNKAFGMRYSPLPPYEIEETGSISAPDMRRIKNFARFWELIVNRALFKGSENASFFNFLYNGSSCFHRFMSLSDSLYAEFDKNWGIDRNDLLEAVKKFMKIR